MCKIFAQFSTDGVGLKIRNITRINHPNYRLPNYPQTLTRGGVDLLTIHEFVDAIGMLRKRSNHHSEAQIISKLKVYIYNY